MQVNEDQKAIQDLRKEYSSQQLNEEDAGANPFDLFKTWFDEAVKADVLEPNAMCVSSCGKDLKPSSRFVLLKGFDERGFVFYTNYESRKSQQLTENPNAAATFWWGALERQIRIEGQVEKVSSDESDQYFNSRGKGSQIGAWTSDQSRPIENRAELEKKEDELKKKYEAMEKVERPPHWGGWRIIPSYIEFWKGRQSRLHDRIVFEREEASQNLWSKKRLQP
uniref:pyridoxal 5'-phosphate synthase n=1 Tax=Strombidium rassoulzadegani TaxID=1082188 RepID=A0A7S3CLY1_9SPIT|mmetsp:Transcript_16327/g.27609  ORF Transcript_16327/g.27609 Transcript_16327/m.27609 type:complete len:223 (+) Transcript_16327:108-776(+)